MTLKRYRHKRHFQQTPEPSGRTAKGHAVLRFVVQKHWATRLHYDFRLELGGVLKSWAVPKGPSIDPADKRLAIMVEDHPFDYRTFEGVIPPGNYGAGTVMIWDEGTYHVPESTDHEDVEAIMAKGLREGRLHFVLEGKRLQGEFSLVRLRKGEKNAWLLIKKGDQFAGTVHSERDVRSAVSGRTREEIERAIKDPPAMQRSGRHVAELDQSAAPKGKMPTGVRPMLATAVQEPFDRPGWLFEIKWDGYRAIAEVRDRQVRLYSRNHKSFEDRYPSLVQALGRFGHDAVLDGEIVVLDPKGRPRFELLQNYQKTGQGQLAYFVFDLLYLDGHDLQSLPLLRRRELLQQVVGPGTEIRFSEQIEERGIDFFKAVSKQGLEGMMAKDGASVYLQGQRGPHWLKVKVHSRQEAAIGGFTVGKGSRKNFGALVLGVYEAGDLIYIGHTGGGFSDRSLADVYARLEPLVTRKCPFKTAPATNAPVQWVRPQLVCEVTFQEWTADGRMRHPIFLGLREDKPARSVRREIPGPAQELAEQSEEHEGPKEHLSMNGLGKDRPTRKKANEQAGVTPSPRLTNLGKAYWPDEGYKKQDLIDYYREIAPVILPYLRGRPETLHRHPDGIARAGFYQKDAGRQAPEWVKTVSIPSQSDGKKIRYIVCQDEATLLYLANLGCIELNPWHSRLASLDQPDYAVIDLDPEDVPFPEVVKVAQAVRTTLEDAEVDCFCKTSGKRGLHIYVPLGARHDTDHARQFAEVIANLVHEQLPSLTSVVRKPAQRQRRVYLDYLQNRRGQTLAAAYSVRPNPGATVSTPLKWSEVRSNLDPAKFTIRTLAKRVDKVGDLWQPVLGPGIDLRHCLELLTERLSE